MYTSIINQFLSSSVIFDNMYNYTTNKLCDLFDNVIIYTVVHDLSDPFKKTYSCVFIPFLYLTINHAIFGYDLHTNNISDNDMLFYESLVVFKRKVLYFVSNNSLKKITSDFKKIDCLSITVDNCIFKKMYKTMTDFQLTANHICVLLKKDIGEDVICTNNELDEITFKDIDVIK